MACLEIGEASFLWDAKAEGSRVAERDGHDGRAGDQTLPAVAVSADVVSTLGVVPIEKQAVQLRVNGVGDPVKVGREDGGYRYCLAHAAAELIVAAVGLLPARGGDHLAMDEDFVRSLGVQVPQVLETLHCSAVEVRRQATAEEREAIKDAVVLEACRMLGLWRLHLVGFVRHGVGSPTMSRLRTMSVGTSTPL